MELSVPDSSFHGKRGRRIHGDQAAAGAVFVNSWWRGLVSAQFWHQAGLCWLFSLESPALRTADHLCPSPQLHPLGANCGLELWTVKAMPFSSRENSPDEPPEPWQDPRGSTTCPAKRFLSPGWAEGVPKVLIPASAWPGCLTLPGI